MREAGAGVGVDWRSILHSKWRTTDAKRNERSGRRPAAGSSAAIGTLAVAVPPAGADSDAVVVAGRRGGFRTQWSQLSLRGQNPDDISLHVNACALMERLSSPFCGGMGHQGRFPARAQPRPRHAQPRTSAFLRRATVATTAEEQPVPPPPCEEAGRSIVIRRPRRRGLPPGSRILRGWGGSGRAEGPAMATWAHSSGRSGRVSRTTQPRTSAVLRRATADTTAEEPTVPPPPCEGRSIVIRRSRGARGGCRRVGGFFAKGRIGPDAGWRRWRPGLTRLADPAWYQVHRQTAAMPSRIQLATGPARSLPG